LVKKKNFTGIFSTNHFHFSFRAVPFLRCFLPSSNRLSFAICKLLCIQLSAYVNFNLSHIHLQESPTLLYPHMVFPILHCIYFLQLHANQKLHATYSIYLRISLVTPEGRLCETVLISALYVNEAARSCDQALSGSLNISMSLHVVFWVFFALVHAS